MCAPEMPLSAPDHRHDDQPRRKIARDVADPTTGNRVNNVGPGGDDNQKSRTYKLRQQLPGIVGLAGLQLFYFAWFAASARFRAFAHFSPNASRSS